MKNTIKARFNKNGNIKVGSMWVWNKVKGAKTYNTVYGAVKGSCGKYCEFCEKPCYVEKSYIRWTDKNGNNQVINSHARNTLAIRKNVFQAFKDLNAQIDRAKNKPSYIRIHQSGEIEKPIELLLWVMSAKKHPNIKYYTYTKNVDAVKMVINTFDNGAAFPKNIVINISIWHEYLLEEFKQLEKYPFIKAFVYDDKTFDYAAHGLKIDTYCMAYDEKGKMNHAITCDKCRKCIDGKCKIIGCFDH